MRRPDNPKGLEEGRFEEGGDEDGGVVHAIGTQVSQPQGWGPASLSHTDAAAVAML